MTENYVFFKVIESRNQDVSKATIPLKGRGKNNFLFLASSGCQQSLACLFSWLHNSSLSFSLHMAFFSLVALLPNCPLLTRPSIIFVLGLTLVQYDHILTWWHLQGPYFQIGSYSLVLHRHEFLGKNYLSHYAQKERKVLMWDMPRLKTLLRKAWGIFHREFCFLYTFS